MHSISRWLGNWFNSLLPVVGNFTNEQTHWMTSKLQALVLPPGCSKKWKSPKIRVQFVLLQFGVPRKEIWASWWEWVAEPAFLPYSVDLTMKFWRLMGFMTTGGPAVRGQAWNLASVAFNHSLSETVLGMVPVSTKNVAVLDAYLQGVMNRIATGIYVIFHSPPNAFLSETNESHRYATAKDPISEPTM